MNNAIIAGDPDIQRSIDAISAKKREAAAWFEQHGYPHQKLEDWKYTPVHRITAPDYVLPGRDTASLLSKESFATLPFTGLDAWYLVRSEEHTSELQSLMRNSYAVFCL